MSIPPNEVATLVTRMSGAVCAIVMVGWSMANANAPSGERISIALSASNESSRMVQRGRRGEDGRSARTRMEASLTTLLARAHRERDRIDKVSYNHKTLHIPVCTGHQRQSWCCAWKHHTDL
jgi:hypothetical protein